MKRKAEKILLRFLLAAVVLCAFPSLARANFHGRTIQEGIYANGISLGGMTSIEAIETLDAYFQSVADSEFTITCMDGQTETARVGDWGLSWDSASAVRQALVLGRSGGIIDLYKERTDLKKGNIYLDVPYSFNTTKIRESLSRKVASHDNPAKNATIQMQENGTFAVTGEGSNGVVTDLDVTMPLIIEQLTDHFGDGMAATVITRTDTPSVTSKDLMVIKDKLGSFTTEYGNSSDGRKTNIGIATGFLNGRVLLPGESLSVSRAIRSRTEENGYKLAAQYSNGESEQALGGGVCQVSTTLYNALIRAELEINERHNHSMVVSYVDRGTDAAIADDTKDLVFTNNLENPIYIYGSADGDYLTFAIYGVEYRPANRTIEFVAKTESEEYIKEKKVKYSDEYKKGTSQVTGTQRPAVTATLTKIVYIDGQVSERILLHTDYYMGSALTITYGTG